MTVTSVRLRLLTLLFLAFFETAAPAGFSIAGTGCGGMFSLSAFFCDKVSVSKCKSGKEMYLVITGSDLFDNDIYRWCLHANCSLDKVLVVSGR
jgi:hypothetical protein